MKKSMKLLSRRFKRSFTKFDNIEPFESFQDIDIDELVLEVEKSEKSAEEINEDIKLLHQNIRELQNVLRKIDVVEVYKSLNDNRKAQWKLFENDKKELRIQGESENFNTVIYRLTTRKNYKTLCGGYKRDMDGKHFELMKFKSQDAYDYIETHKTDSIIFYIFEG